MLGLAHLKAEQNFTPDDLDILTRFAQLASIALDNARLYGILLGDGHLSKDGMQWGVSGNPQNDEHLEFVRTLLRSRGNPVESRTKNISQGGMRVTTPRPLAIDEILEFRLETGIEGVVRVLREHLPNEYALRFEQISLDALSRLERLA